MKKKKSQLEEARYWVQLLPTMRPVKLDVENLLDRAQNLPPYGEADGTISKQQYNALRNLAYKLEDYQEALGAAVAAFFPERRR